MAHYKHNEITYKQFTWNLKLQRNGNKSKRKFADMCHTMSTLSAAYE